MSRGLVEIIGSIFAGKRKTEGPAPPAEIRLSGGVESAGMYSRNPHSSILASVLTTPAEALPAKHAARTSLSKTVGAGDELRKAREMLLAAGEELARLSDAAVAGYIRRLLAMVEAQHCAIAFIGQMNAGKSSLINAFVGSPQLLPTEITPWTTVVTNLYFGIAKQPTSGALFEFFSPAEWQQLAEGSARVRALTEQLMPGFPWQDFYRQVGNMREKAQEKLGARYAELLGKQHTVPVATLDVLEKYIAAESPLGDEDGRSAGEFSMITKAAHLYFDLASFFYPTMVIDTPGINDPFLVRDEITRQNLERANVFVIVVTARQPLSNADLDLLRILRGLQKDNIVIFVNKTDELGDEAGHADAIKDRIRALMKKEFPGADIPIIMGSALWAEIALGDDLAEKRELAGAAGLDTPHSASPEAQAAGFWLSSADVEDTVLTEKLLMRSGIGDLALAISALLRNGNIAGSISYVAAVLAGIARNGAARARENVAMAETLMKDQGGRRAAALATRLDTAATILQEMDAQTEDLADSFAAIMRQASIELSSRLNSSAATVLADWRAQRQSVPGKQAGAQLGALTVRLRSALEHEFLAGFQDTLANMTTLSLETEQALRQQLAAAGAVLQTTIYCPELPTVKSSPSLAALGDPVATDMSALMQGRLGGALASPEKLDAVEAIVADEFRAMVNKLTGAAQDELRRSAGFMLDQMRATVSHALRTVIVERQGLLALVSATPDGDPSRAEREKAAAMAKLSEELALAAVAP